jgi:hypothetical protein
MDCLDKVEKDFKQRIVETSVALSGEWVEMVPTLPAFSPERAD